MELCHNRQQCLLECSVQRCPDVSCCINELWGLTDSLSIYFLKWVGFGDCPFALIEVVRMFYVVALHLICCSITTAFDFPFDNHWCFHGGHLRVQWQVQPHVLDLWCVGLACCVLCVLVLGAFAWLFDFVSNAICEVPSFTGWRKFWVGQSSTGCKPPRSTFRLVRALALFALLHSGEALNPGPLENQHSSKERAWSLGTFNPSGLCGKHQVIGSYLGDCDIWAVSETHLTSRGFASFKNGLKGSSEFQYCVGGAHVPLRQHSNKTGEWSGVCMLSKHPTRQLPIQWPSQTYETSRVLLTTALCQDMWIIGAVIYGEPPGVTHPDAQQNTDLIAHDLFTQLYSIGGLRFFAGDFNFEKGGLAIFQQLEAAGFRDLQDLALEKFGKSPQKTCKYSTRKDFCFISPELQSFFVDVQVDHSVWADHAVLQGLFRGGSDDLVTHHWRIPAQVDWPKTMCCAVPPEWYQQHDPDLSYATLWSSIEDSTSCTLVSQGKFPLPSRCKGRGQTIEVKLRKAPFRSGPLRPGRHGDVKPTFVGTSQQHAHWFRQLRRLQSYCRFRRVHLTDCDNAHGASLWSSVIRAKGFSGGFCNWWQVEGAKVFGASDKFPLIPPPEQQARAIYDSFLLDVRRLEQTLRSQQRKFAVDRRKELAHVIFQDIKRSSPDRVDVLLRVTSGKVIQVDCENAALMVQTSQPLVPDHPIFVDGLQQDVIYVHDTEIWLPSVEGIVVGSEVRQSSFTGAAIDMFKAFEVEWKARWDRHKHVPPSQWSQICAFVREHFHQIPCSLPDIDAQAIRGELSRKKRRSATGLDGVSLTDLKSMPDEILSAYCHIFDQAESLGSWPNQLVTGKVASLAKVSSPESVQSFRPITVLSHGYRLWSGLRAKFLLAHLHPHCPAFLFGNRPHCQASQVWTYLAWAIEASFVSDVPVGGIVADIEKAFNHLSREVVFQTALSLGMPHKLLVAWSGARGQLTRRFQIREHTGPPLTSSTGFPEGDALSWVAMMLMDFVYHVWFERSFPLCQPVSYVDDLQLISRCPSQVPQLFEHLLTFANHVDLTIDAKKTFVWSNSAYHRANFCKLALQVRPHARGLGAQLQFTRKHSTAVITDRLRDLEPLWSKLRTSPSPYRIKVLAVKQAAWTLGLHGIAASSVSASTFTRLRTGVMRGLAVEGAGCSPVIHLGLVEHPSLDPKCWTILSTLRTVREAASSDSLTALLQAALDPDSALPSYSMTSLLVERLRSLGWTIQKGVNVSDHLGTFSLLHSSFQELSLRVCWAWPRVVASAVHHRSSFRGLADCNVSATRRYLQSLSVVDQGLFRKALNGAHFTQDAICHWSTSGATTCEFCGGEDSRFHRFWACPVFAAERAHCTEEFWEVLASLPPCLTLHGWALRPKTWESWYRTLIAIEMPEVCRSPSPIFTADGWIDVFSDGSCLWPQQQDLRIAAWAIIQAHPSGVVSDSQILLAGQCPAILQSAFRAELIAVYQALRYAWYWKQRIRIWSDCQSVVNRLHVMLSTRSAPAANSNHADIWNMIYELLECLQFHQAAANAAEHWAFAHNAMVDRAARLANLQRTVDF